MSFMNPLWLWGALAAAGVATPIVIHLLNKPRARELDWAAMSLLRRAMDERAEQVRVEDRLLLLLRCVGLALIALAMARPTLQGGVSGWLGGPRSVGVVIGVDVSYSMGYREVGSRLEEAKRAARRIAGGLKPGEPISLVAMGAEPRVLLDRVAYSETRLGKALDGLDSGSSPLNVEAGLRTLEELLATTRTEARQCYLISDGQARSWEGLSAGAGEALRRLGESGAVHFVPVGEPGASNLAIERFELASGGVRRGTTARYVARVRNGGERPIDGASVTLYRDGEPTERAPVQALEPGETAGVAVRVHFEEAETEVLEARLPPDGLPIDNARWAVAAVRRTVDVLIVDGDPSPRRYASETAFVTAALRPTPGGEVAESLRIERVSDDQWSALRDELRRFDVIITANVGRIDPALLEPLAGWVRSGGGLLIFPGDQVTAPVFNRQLVDGRFALSPARLNGLVAGDTETGGSSLEPTDARHRLTRLLRSLPGDLAKTTRLRRYFRLQPTEGAGVLWIVRERGHPALVEKSLGRGRVLLFASSADRGWTDMPVFPVFPMMLHESVSHLTSPSHERPRRVGEAIALTLPAAPTTERVWIDPPGPSARVTLEAAFDGGTASVRYERTETPGVYRIGYRSDRPALPVAVNVQPGEGDIRSLGPAALSVALGERVALLDDPSQWSTAVSAARSGRELGPWLLGLGLAMMVGEAWAARWFTRRAAAGMDEAEARPRRSSAPGAAQRPAA